VILRPIVAQFGISLADPPCLNEFCHPMVSSSYWRAVTDFLVGEGNSGCDLGNTGVLGRRLELRWDMLNMFNNTHFGLPSQDVSSGTFGQISNLAGDPRVMQFALKFHF